MSRYTITPWRTHADLLTVRQQLYSPNTANNPEGQQEEDPRRTAVSRILAWKTRGNLPHAIESTALLTDAILHHDLSVNSIFSVRAVYAAAFTRFVTGFCDIGRNRERSLEPSSMLEIARQIDMPDEFVALRHEATHEDLPSVQRLVGVCGQALEWLWRVYWSRLAEVEVAEESVATAVVAVDLQHVRDEGRKVLKEYRSARKQSLKGKGAAATQGQGEVVRKATDECERLCRNQEPAVSALVGTLLGEKMLYPSDRGLGAPMNGAYLLWDVLLQSISKRQHFFLSSLLQEMHTAMNRPSAYYHVLHDPEKQALHHWLLHIATSDAWAQTRGAAGIDVAADLMTECCLHPSPWSHALGDALLENGDEVFKESWSDLLLASVLAGGVAGVDSVDAVPEEANHDTQDVDMSEAQEKAAAAATGSIIGEDHQSEADVADANMAGWREALKAPKVPIGVV